MSYFRRVILIALLLLVFGIPALAQGGGAQVRFVHAIPGASAVDIYMDGQLTISDLAYGGATHYVDITAGTHHVAVTQNGSNTSLWEQDVDASADAALTLVASSAANSAFEVYQDDLNPLALGKSRFTAIHAISGADGVDIILSDGRPVIPGLQYSQPYGTLDLPAMTYDLAVVPAGQAVSDAIVPAQTFKLNTGTSYIALVYGTSDAAQTMLLSAPTRSDEAAGYARIAHVVPGAADLDVFINDTLAAPSLGFGEATDYIALPAGSYTVSARTPGATSDLVTGTLDVTAGGRQTALVAGSAEAPAVQSFEDVVNAVSESASVLSLMNLTSAATVSATYSDGSALLGSVSSGNSDSALLEPSDMGIDVVVTDSSNADAALDLPGGIYGGVYYSAVAVDGTDGAQIVQLPAVSLAQGTASAPGDQTLASAMPTEMPTPTAAPTEVAQQPTPAPATPEPTADNSGVQIQAQPSAVPTTTGPTAVVLVNPDVNLQLRQYPNREALSLGLAPSGAVLHVNGREGEPVPPVGTTATPLAPNATPYVDPVTLLQGNDDLDPAQTWVNVTYDTPDGGTVTAWVNALYIGIHDTQNRPLALRDLATIPSNRAGNTQNTAMEPPSPQEIVTMAIVGNLDPGVRIHIRRIPSTDGESLALVPGGTQMELVGINQSRDWAFVRYAGTDSTVTGWMDDSFLTYQRNNQSVDFNRLQELGELNIISEDQRGSVVSNGQPASGVSESLRNVVAGEVSGLNADANLHLRRHENDQAESLALLPNGTILIVTGRTPDDAWLQVTYQNQPGWVSSEYVTLTFNGQPYEMANLPVIEPTPTPTPETQG